MSLAVAIVPGAATDKGSIIHGNDGTLTKIAIAHKEGFLVGNTHCPLT